MATQNSLPPEEPDGNEIHVPEHIKKSVRAVLLSKIGGVPLGRFPKDYEKLDGHPLNYKELGFKTLSSCLKAMPDVVRFQRSEKADMWMLYGIGDSKSYMSSAAKKAQYARPNDGIKEKNKMFKGKKRNKDSKTATNNNLSEKGRDSPKEKGKECPREKGRDSPRREGPKNYPRKLQGESVKQGSQAGGELRVTRSLKGLYTVCVRCHPLRNPPEVMEEIRELFSEQGDVVEEHYVNTLLFFRFAQESEAVEVIQRFNGRQLRDGTRIRVSPGKERIACKEKVGEGVSRTHRSTPEIHNVVRPEPIPIPVNGNEHLPPEETVNMVDICVFNLGESSTVEDLLKHFYIFQPHGARVCKKHYSGDHCSREKLYGFVSFSCIAAAVSAQQALHGSWLNGSEIRVEMSVSKGKRLASASEESALCELEQNGENGTTSSPNREEEAKRQDVDAGENDTNTWSEEESCDSISIEVHANLDIQSPPQIHNEAPVVNDFPCAIRTHGTQPERQSPRENGFSLSEGTLVGRGRGALLGHLSPSFGRGFPINASPPPPVVEKKKLRPSLADLIDKVSEL